MSKKPFPEEKKNREQYEATAANERFNFLELASSVTLRCYFVVTQAGVYARRQFCGNLEIYRPTEPL